jgi:drug/metabolite transporter (DMT)-like permease
MLKMLHAHKEAAAFCLFYAGSFILMGEAVKTVDPVTSTFVTYGLTALFFMLINLHRGRQIVAACRKDAVTLFYLNASTLANTLLAFVVMTYVSPLVYVIVFFGTLPFLSAIVKRTAGPGGFAVFASALAAGMLVSDAPLRASAAGVGITLVSAAFAAAYMVKSESFHRKTGIAPSQLLSVRFFLVIVVCGGYALFSGQAAPLGGKDVLLLLSAAVTGSIIPLFLMQISIARLGAATTSRFMPSIPVFCMLCLVLLGLQTFSAAQLAGILAFSLLLFAQTRSRTRKSTP